MKSRALAVGGLALVLVTSRGSAARIAFRPPSPPPPTSSAPVTKVIPIDLATLPTADIPFQSAGAAAPVVPDNAPIATEIDVGHEAFGRWVKVKKAPATQISVQLRLSGAGAPAFMQPNSATPGELPFTLGSTPFFACGPYTPPTVAVRWERFDRDSSGAPTLDITEGALAGCAVRVLAHSAVHPAPIVTVDGVDVAFALKHEGSISIFLPPDADVAADTGTTEPIVGHGAVWRVDLPIGKGTSGTVVAHVNDPAFSHFESQMTGKPPVAKPSNREITIGIDVSQTVTDDAPSLVARVKARG